VKDRAKTVVLITGASKRIGATLSRHFHQLNYQVVIHYRNGGEAAAKLENELNHVRENSAFKIQADLTSREGIHKIAVFASQLEHRLTLVIHNAGLFSPTPITGATRETWDQLFETNLKAPYFLTQALLPWVDHRASFIFLGDMFGEIPLKHYSAYSASKAGLAMITRSLALELAPNHRVNGIALGAILPPSIDQPGDATVSTAGEREPESEAYFDLDQLLDGVPLSRLGTPTHVALVAEFLASNNYVTGQMIATDGGKLTRAQS